MGSACEHFHVKVLDLEQEVISGTQQISLIASFATVIVAGVVPG
jgi:hypothetical protein